MASDRTCETRKIACTVANNVEDFGATLRGVCFSADADILVDFDQPTDLGSFLIKSGVAPAYLPVPVQRVYARAVTGTGNLYILGLR